MANDKMPLPKIWISSFDILSAFGFRHSSFWNVIAALVGGQEFFHIYERHANGADERLGLAKTVAVAAAGDEQMVFLRNLQIAFGHHGGMFGVKAFDAVESGVHEVGNDFVGAVQAGMRHDR